jgi:hypothetical protein
MPEYDAYKSAEYFTVADQWEATWSVGASLPVAECYTVVGTTYVVLERFKIARR